jgi:WD40-like Beta Propeller Repeat
VRTTRASPWGAAYPVTEVANPPGGPAKDFAPSVDAVETTFMFSSNRLGSQSYDIYEATRPGSGMPWGTPTLVPGINGAVDDWDPFVAQGGLVVFFTSVRQGAGDLFWAARQSTAEAFPPPQPLVDLNSTAYDSDASFSQDLTYVIFDSTRGGTTDLYEAHAVF